MYIATELKQNQVYSILIEDWNEEVTGVFVAEGKEWILLYDNQNDFLIEGFRFVQKSKLDEILRDEDELFKEKIFSKKYSELSFDVNYNLDDTVALLTQIKKENKLFHFDTEDEEEIIVGCIEEVEKSSFKIKSLTSTAVWGESFSCEFSEISTISVQNDYLKSLSLIVD